LHVHRLQGSPRTARQLTVIAAYVKQKKETTRTNKKELVDNEEGT
jgi:hypothetical protein